MPADFGIYGVTRVWRECGGCLGSRPPWTLRDDCVGIIPKPLWELLASSSCKGGNRFGEGTLLARGHTPSKVEDSRQGLWKFKEDKTWEGVRGQDKDWGKP